MPPMSSSRATAYRAGHALCLPQRVAVTVASMLPIEEDRASDDVGAIAEVPSVRPGTVETTEQEEFILNWVDRGAPYLR